MSLAKSISDLVQPTSKEVPYTARTDYDGRTGFIQTGALAEAPKSYDEILELFGYDPKEVRIIGNPRISKWQTYDERWLSSYKFQLGPVIPHTVIDLMGVVNKHKPHKPQLVTGTGVYNFQAGDQQLGKVNGTNGVMDDGVESTVERFLESIDVAVADYKRLRKVRNIGGINAMFPGDCIEGIVSQRSMNMWRTSLTLTEQLRLFRRLLMYTVEQFAPLTDNMWLRVVNGNHDEATRAQNTRPDDGFATEQAIAVADALEMNTKAFGHVVVEVPPLDQGWMTVKSFDSIFTIAHGHQWRRGKAMDWIANQALHATNVSATHFLVHGHEHRWTIDTNGARTVICSPAYDAGSSWLQNGSWGIRGGLGYVTNGAEITDMRVI